MAKQLKYYVGVNLKSDRRQVFGAHARPTAASHGKHFSAVIGPFANLRAALYVRDKGFNNPQIRCPGDAEKLCKTRSAPVYQRTAAKLRRGKRGQRSEARGQTKRKKNPVQVVVLPHGNERRLPYGVRRGRKAIARFRRGLSQAQLRAGFGGKARQRTKK